MIWWIRCMMNYLFVTEDERSAGMKKDSGWTVRAVAVSFVGRERCEKPLEDCTENELKELRRSGQRRNLEALAVAGYVPVAKRKAARRA